MQEQLCPTSQAAQAIQAQRETNKILLQNNKIMAEVLKELKGLRQEVNEVKALFLGSTITEL